jgi:hypothetical protein
MLTAKAVAALIKLCSDSSATRKKKLGTELAKIFDQTTVKQAVEATKLKQGPFGDAIDDALQTLLPASVFNLVQTIGPVALKLILDKLKVV